MVWGSFYAHLDANHFQQDSQNVRHYKGGAQPMASQWFNVMVFRLISAIQNSQGSNLLQEVDILWYPRNVWIFFYTSTAHKLPHLAALSQDFQYLYALPVAKYYNT